MNFHFTTAKAHITRVGGRVEELVSDAGLQPESDLPFKGNIDIESSANASRETGRNTSRSSASRRVPTSSAVSRFRWRICGEDGEARKEQDPRRAGREPTTG